eukprot:GGOE01040861.1.p1 GENE.GGOE01040861.1~~GGOE01040861.1.p1  ORF type:complete len:922 (-),score=208.26 GGOE01040861.1:90-2705(-)
MTAHSTLSTEIIDTATSQPAPTHPKVPPAFHNSATTFDPHRLSSKPSRPTPPTRVHWSVPSNSEAAPLDVQRSPFAPFLQTFKHTQLDRGDPRTNVWSMEHIVANQFVRDCDERQFLIYSIATDGAVGLFSVINQMVSALATALMLNRTLMFVTQGDKPWMYAPRSQCLDMRGRYQAWNCYLEPLTNCDLPKVVDVRRLGRPQGHLWTKLEEFLTYARNYKGVTLNVYFARQLFASLTQNPPLDSARHLQHNANLVAFLFRPVKPILKYKEALKRRLGLDRVSSFATLHVRRTDKANEAFLYTTTEYIQMLVKSGAPKDVFIMTDDAEVVQGLRTRASLMSQDFRFYSSPQWRPAAGVTPMLQKAKEGEQPAVVQHVVEFAADCLLAAEAQYFIGTCSSNVDWSIPQLIAARTGLFAINQSSRLLAPDRCVYWARHWPFDPTVFGKQGIGYMDLVRASFSRYTFSRGEIDIMKKRLRGSREAWMRTVLAGIEDYEVIMAQETPDRLLRLKACVANLNALFCRYHYPTMQQECDSGAAPWMDLVRQLFQRFAFTSLELVVLRTKLDPHKVMWHKYVTRKLSEYEAILTVNSADAASRTLQLQAIVLLINGAFCRFLDPVDPIASECAVLHDAQRLCLKGFLSSNSTVPLDALSLHRLQALVDPPVWLWHRLFLRHLNAFRAGNAVAALDGLQTVICRYLVMGLEDDCPHRMAPLRTSELRGIFDSLAIPDDPMAGLKARFLTREDLTVWELRAWTALQNYEEEVRRGGEGLAAEKEKLNAFLCLFFPMQLRDRCSSPAQLQWLRCGMYPLPDDHKPCLDLLGLREMVTAPRLRLHQTHLLEFEHCRFSPQKPPPAMCTKYQKPGGLWGKLDF